MSARGRSQFSPPPAPNYDDSYYDLHRRPERKREQRDPRDYVPRSAKYTPSEYSHAETYTQRPPPAGSEHSYHPPTEPAAAEDQYQLAPYDDEKAYAEYSRVYGPSSPEPVYEPLPRQRRRNSYDDYRPPQRRERPRYDDERSDDLVTYDRRGRPNDDLSLDDVSTRYDDRASRYDSPPRKKPEDDEKSGLKSSLIGGASGAYLGNRFVGKGALGTLGGAVVGAIGVNAMEHFDGKRQRKREEKDRRRRVDSVADEALDDAPRRRHYAPDYESRQGESARPAYDERDYGRRHRPRPRPRYRSFSADGYSRY